MASWDMSEEVLSEKTEDTEETTGSNIVDRRIASRKAANKTGGSEARRTGSSDNRSNYQKMQQKAREKRMARAKRTAAEKIVKDLAKEGEKDKAGKKPKSDYQKYLDDQLKFKKEKYANQQKRTAKSVRKEGEKQAKEYRKQGADALRQGLTPSQRISSENDSSVSAMQKGFENLGDAAQGALKAGIAGTKSVLAKRRAEKKAREIEAKQNQKKEKQGAGRPQKPQTPAQLARVKGELPGTKVKGLLPPESRQKEMRRRLPPSSQGASRVGQPAAGSRPMLPGSMKRKMLPAAGESGPTRTAKGTIGTSRVGKPAAERPALKPAIDKRRMLPPSSRSDRPATPAAGRSSLGQQARANAALRARLTKERGGKTDFKKAKKKVLGLESYSWRDTFSEEFLFEVDKKSKKREDKVIDIMRGKNKLTIHPMQENHQKISSGMKKDREGYMANRQLDSMERAIAALRKKLTKEDDQLPAWVQSKITKAADYIDTASDYMQGTTMKEDMEEILAKKFLVEIDKSKMKCNKPKAQAVGNSLTGKSHVVKACANGQEKIIRFGQRGVKGSPKKKGESKAYASRRSRFKSRHAKNIAKGKMSAAYWANRVKW